MNLISRQAGKVKVAAIVVLMTLSACSSPTPKYYQSVELASKLECFNWNDQKNEPPQYKRAFARTDVSDNRPGDSPNPEDRNKVIPTLHSSDSLLYLAISRINSSFAGTNGIYHSLFKETFNSNSIDGNIHCAEISQDNTLSKESNANMDEDQVAISPFSIPVPASGTLATATLQSQNGSTPQADKAGSNKASGNKAGSKLALGNNKATTQKPLAENSNGNMGSHSQATNGSLFNDWDATLELPTEIVISSYLYSTHPADRLDKVYILITPLEPGVEFVSIDKIDVAPQLIDFGQLTTSMNVNGSAIPLGKAYGQLLSATPSFSQAFQREIKRQYATQNVEIFPLRNILLISEDGGPAGADLSGNKSVTVTIRIPVGSRLCTYQTVYEFTNGKFSPGTSICHIDRIPAVMGAVSLERKVTSGQNTIDESDDAVKLVPFKNLAVFNLWANPNELYGIRYGDKLLLLDKQKPLLFRDYAGALNFRSWLEDNANKSPPICVDIGSKKVCADSSGKPAICIYRSLEPDYGISIPQRSPSDFCRID